MKMKAPSVKSLLALLALVLALVLPPSFKVSAQQGSERTRDVGVDSISVKVEGGKFVKLYDKSYALVIGASEYTAGWRRLPGVKKDVEAVARTLESHGFQVTISTNPASAQLYDDFKDFIDKYGKNVENRLLFYFAGHGHTMKHASGDEVGYIVPVDAPLPDKDPDGFTSKAMDMEQMKVFARRVQAKHALFVFDSCFSGSILFDPTRSETEREKIITYKTTQHVRQFIASGEAGETVPDESIFRKQFVAALEGEADSNKDSYITGTELGEFLQAKVIKYAEKPQHPQYGKIKNPNLDKGDFVFSLKREAARIPKDPKPGTVVTGAAGIELVYIPPGSFMMGSSDADVKRTVEDAKNKNFIVTLDWLKFEVPQHPVTLREGFWMGKYEITRAQWEAIMNYDPSNRDRNNSPGDNLPVDSVSWNDAQRFIRKLNEADDGFEYRLPSEAEWEYATRAGTTTAFAFGDSLGSNQANFDGNFPYGGAAKGDAQGRTTPVGSFKPNRWGLYDMHGNVWEWVQDVWHESYADDAPKDGAAWLRGGDTRYRMLRGGSWGDVADGLRSAARIRREPDNRHDSLGLRVVAVARQ
jgi:formylglycine-generating enzyme required for sulfatase activity